MLSFTHGLRSAGTGAKMTRFAAGSTLPRPDAVYFLPRCNPNYDWDRFAEDCINRIQISYLGRGADCELGIVSSGLEVFVLVLWGERSPAVGSTIGILHSGDICCNSSV
jgi:hypothetical protein